LAILTATRLASSLESNFAADLRPGSSSKLNIRERLSVVIADDKAGVEFLGPPLRTRASIDLSAHLFDFRKTCGQLESDVAQRRNQRSPRCERAGRRDKCSS
jgi:hypothetical protein